METHWLDLCIFSDLKGERIIFSFYCCFYYVANGNSLAGPVDFFGFERKRLFPNVCYVFLLFWTVPTPGAGQIGKLISFGVTLPKLPSSVDF